MAKWRPSQHSIADIRDWRNNSRLELQPDFQRREVWGRAAKIMLIDTILKEIPIPKIIINTVLRNESTYRIVIDGQQRLTAILEFLSDGLQLSAPYEGAYLNMKFGELPVEIRNHILEYNLDFNEVSNSSEDELRDVYSRVNKYTVKLNKQELRHADFPGDFLRLSEKLAEHEFLEEIRLFTPANRRRRGDIEFTSELIIALLEGPQNKKETLDDFYQRYMKWDSKDMQKIQDRFKATLQDIKHIFCHIHDTAFCHLLPIEQTRFRQKSDFYSLFVAIDKLIADGLTLEHKILLPLQHDFFWINEYTKPSSCIDVLAEYGIRCSTDANSFSSRKWRMDFLLNILAGTYRATPPNKSVQKTWSDIRWAIAEPIMCPSEFSGATCSICEKDFAEDNGDVKHKEPATFAWPSNSNVFQMSNLEYVHKKCVSERTDWIVLCDSDS